jgi:hypothetical protein
MDNKKVLTKGNVVINEIKIGDIHYEYEYGICCKTQVLTLPVRDDEGFWSWKAKQVGTDRIIDYGQNENYPHYGINLYDYEAYKTSK